MASRGSQPAAIQRISYCISNAKVFLIQIKPNPSNCRLAFFLACQNLLLNFVLLVSRKSQVKVEFYQSIIYLFVYFKIGIK